jgi:hypothetical protein
MKLIGQQHQLRGRSVPGERGWSRTGETGSFDPGAAIWVRAGEREQGTAGGIGAASDCTRSPVLTAHVNDRLTDQYAGALRFGTAPENPSPTSGSGSQVRPRAGLAIRAPARRWWFSADKESSVRPRACSSLPAHEQTSAGARRRSSGAEAVLRWKARAEEPGPPIRFRFLLGPLTPSSSTSSNR